MFSIKNNIGLRFAPHREDEPQIWRSWLLYPTKAIDEKQEHRIALSLRAKDNNQTTDYLFRFFDTLPLRGYLEI